MGFKSKFNMQTMPEKKKENLISALYIGLIFVMLAVIYLSTSAQTSGTASTIS